ncbi:hypothetical protein LJR234_002342 [Mesorhizobium amorphae]|uniref:hypothetical protein n=1 Tax=Mesorhizobium amorphae TaxID=71433 RepID=UPI003ECC2FBC
MISSNVRMGNRQKRSRRAKRISIHPSTFSNARIPCAMMFVAIPSEGIADELKPPVRKPQPSATAPIGGRQLDAEAEKLSIAIEKNA